MTSTRRIAMSKSTAQSKEKTRKKYDSDDSKKRLLSAALDIFAKTGYEAATTRAIAKKAGVNDSLIQRYFGGKMGLLLELSRDFKERVVEVTMASEEGTLESDLRHFFQSKIEYSRKHKKLLKILITQAIVNPEFRKEVSRFSKTDNPTVISQVSELQQKGLIHKQWDPAKLSRFINILPTTVSMLSEVICSISPDYVEEFIPMAVSILARGLK
jgi:TetR/AcrR family transcriptional regulator, regulator of cefoperazone and chloramphenicol sensitivity